MHQLQLLKKPSSDKRTKIGQTDVDYTQARSILTRTSGFLDTYELGLTQTVVYMLIKSDIGLS